MGQRSATHHVAMIGCATVTVIYVGDGWALL
jgi:hypothetical protein